MIITFTITVIIALLLLLLLLLLSFFMFSFLLLFFNNLNDRALFLITGFECDYSLYPSKKFQFQWLNHYLNAYNPGNYINPITSSFDQQSINQLVNGIINNGNRQISYRKRDK